jgi:hypothetical protein
MKPDLTDLATKIRRAVACGIAASEAQTNDGGSANLDHVCVFALKGVREPSMRKAGIGGYKGSNGTYHLDAPFGGQGQKRYAGVQAMYEALKADGVACYVHYQLD